MAIHPFAGEIQHLDFWQAVANKADGFLSVRLEVCIEMGCIFGTGCVDGRNYLLFVVIAIIFFMANPIDTL